MRTNVWAFDVDGVVANTFPILQSEIEKAYGICWFDMPYWPTRKFSNVNGKLFMKILNGLIDDGRVKPIKQAVDVIREYHKKYRKVVFITNRERNLTYATYEFLSKHFKFEYQLYIGSGMDKLVAAKHAGCRGIIDDKVETIRYFDENGYGSILHCQPHQKWEDTSGLCVMNWNEIAEVIL